MSGGGEGGGWRWVEVESQVILRAAAVADGIAMDDVHGWHSVSTSVDLL